MVSHHGSYLRVVLISAFLEKKLLSFRLFWQHLIGQDYLIKTPFFGQCAHKSIDCEMYFNLELKCNHKSSTQRKKVDEMELRVNELCLSRLK